MVITQKYNKKKLKYIDLFCGIGGFRIALDSLGQQCVFSSDIDIEARKTYAENFVDEPYGDIIHVENTFIPNHDVICAGFPCQPFSISGNQNGLNDKRGNLFYEIIRIAKYHKPKILFLENVKNLIRHNNGNTYRKIIKDINNIGYNVFYKVLNSSDYGVPQSRERVYMVCIRKDISIDGFQFPEKSNEKVSLKKVLLSDIETEHLVINRNDIFLKYDVIIDLETKSPNKINQKPYRIGYVNKGGQGERIYHEKGHAITLSAYGGGVGAKTGLYLINKKIRKLHPIECRRLMSFPYDFKINNKTSQSYKQFGNAVVVKIIREIFEKILEVV